MPRLSLLPQRALYPLIFPDRIDVLKGGDIGFFPPVLKILRAAKKENMPEGIFAHLYGAGFAVGEALIKHPLAKAVGFTGSFIGGKQLFDWDNQRKEPIPVFAEMSSINPVFYYLIN